MANTTITGLPNATVPLDGTERVPMDQAGVTVDASALAIAQTLADATTSVAGKMTAADKTKLDGVATGATANSSDATLLARANHTGTQAAGTITGLATVGTTGAYADLSGRPTLGTAAAKNVGTASGNVVELDGSARLPAVDGSQLTGINTAGTDLTYTAATRLLASSTGADATLTLVTSTDAGLAPASGGGTTNFLRADGTFAAPPGGSPGGSNTQIQFNDSGAFGGDADLTYNKTTNKLTTGGDVELNDGGSFTTTLQTVTPTAARTISFPDATGTVALVAGSSGQVVYNNAGAYAGVPSTVIGATGNITLSLNGATGVPPVAVTGTWFAGTTPQVLIQPSNVGTAGAWSASGTGIGVNAVTGFAGNLLDLQVNGSTKFSINKDGSVFGGADGANSFYFVTRRGANFTGWAETDINTTKFIVNGASAADNGSIAVRSGAGNEGLWIVKGFGIGATTSSPNVYAYSDGANILAQRNAANAQTFRVYNTYTSSTNYELGKLEWSSNVFRIGTEKGSGGGTARALELQTDGTTRLTIATNAGAARFAQGPTGQFGWYNAYNNLVFEAYESSGTRRFVVNGLCLFEGNSSAFPALKRNSAALETKLADDSAYAQHAASVFQTATAHTVATLPGTPAVGMIARVTDATAPAVGVTVVGGGAAAALCWYNGANWSVIGV